MAVVSWFYADSPAERNTSLHRVIYPARMMAESGHTCFVGYIGEVLSDKTPQETLDTIDKSQVIVLERLILNSLHDKIKAWRLSGKRVYATFDDHYSIMPLSQMVSRLSWLGGRQPTVLDKMYEEHGVESPKMFNGILNEFRKGLRLCNASFVPSKVLAEDYGAYGTMRYVPNYLYPPLWEGIKSNQDSNDITIIWGGSLGHRDSWKNNITLVWALGELCRKYNNVSVHLQTTDPEVTTIFNKAGVRYTAQPWTTFELWPKVVGSATIGIMPLSGGRYDSSRSNLKALENSMAYLPWVATSDAPYRDSIGGFLVKGKSIKDWMSPLERLINDVSLRKELGEKGHTWSLAHSNSCVSSYEKAMEL